MPNRLLRMFKHRQEVPAATSPLLQSANEQMSAGHYAAAAASFDILAQRNGPRAPLFIMQAGRGYLFSGNLLEAMTHFKKALSMLAAEQQFRRLGKIGMHTVEELKARGHIKEAREINNLVISNMPALADLPTQLGPDPARIIAPITCPACGGPVRADESEWIDAHTCECPYCGVPLHIS